MNYMLHWEKKKSEKAPEAKQQDSRESSDFSPMIIFILVLSAALIAVLLFR